MAWQIIGHNWVVDLLRQGLIAEQAAHAYLFAGPSQVGKTTLARLLAQALNCEQENRPCGHCRSCRKIDLGTHPDVQLIEGDGTGKSIKIDQVRSLQHDAILKPYEGRYRVFILRQADRATPEATDSLLKTLEEPPAHVVLILTANHADSMRPTVVSRCQRLDLRPADFSVIERALLERGVSSSKSHLLARLSGGRMGWALGAMENEDILFQRQKDLDELVGLLAGNRIERLDFAWKASRDPARTRELIDSWTGWWRDLLLLCGQAEEYLVNLDRLEELQSIAARSDLSQPWAVLKALQKTAAHLEANVNARLALESLLLRLPRWEVPASSQV